MKRFNISLFYVLHFESLTNSKPLIEIENDENSIISALTITTTNNGNNKSSAVLTEIPINEQRTMYNTPPVALKPPNPSYSKKPWLEMSSEDEDTVTQELFEALKQVNDLSDAVHSGASVEVKDIMKQKESLEAELIRVQTELKGSKLLEDKYNHLKVCLAASQQDLETRSNEVDQLTARLAVFENEKNNDTSEKEQLQAKNKEYETLLDQAMVDLQTVSDVNEDLATTLEEISAEKDEALKKIQELASGNERNDFDEINGKSNALIVENTKLMEALYESEKGKEESLSQVNILRPEIERLKEELDTISREKEEMIAKMNNYKTINEKNVSDINKIDQLVFENEELSNQIKILESKISVKKESIQSQCNEDKSNVLIIENTRLKGALSESNRNNASNSTQIKLLLSEIDRLQKTLDEISGEKEELYDKVKILELRKQEQHTISDELHKVMRENKSLSNKIKTLTDEKSDLCLKMKEIPRKNNKHDALLQSELNLLERKFAQTKVENEALQTKIRETKRQEECAKVNADNSMKEKVGLEKEVERLCAIESELLIESSKLKERNKGLLLELKELGQKKTDLEGHLMNMVKSAQNYEDLFKKNKQLLADMALSEAEKADAQRSIHAISDTLAAVRNEVKLLKQQKASIEKQLDDEKFRAHKLDSAIAVGNKKVEEASQLINKLKSDVESEKDQTRKYVDQKVRCIKNLLYTLMNDKINDLDLYFLEKFGTATIFVNFGE